MRSCVALLQAVAVALGLTLAAVRCSAQWTDLGLSGREVKQLRSCDGLLYACTTTGLYRKASTTPDSAWVLLGFTGEWVRDVLAVSPETLIVAREVTGLDADTIALFRTIDSGDNWTAFQNGLGALGNAFDRKVTTLLEPPLAPGTIVAATWNGVHKSTDGGATWAKVAFGGRWYFLAAGVATLWGGGEGAALSPFVRRSLDGGDTWTTSFTSGNCCFAADMAFDPSDPNTAFLGLNDGLRKTIDNGGSWTSSPLPAGVGTTTLGSRAYPPPRLYAIGNAPPGGATIFKSDNGGTAWTAISFPEASTGDERRLLVLSGPSSDTVFVGMASGVLRYVETDVVVGVEPLHPSGRSGLELSAYPSPTPGVTTVTFRLPQPSWVSLRIIDSTGRVRASLIDADRGPGVHRLALDARGFRSGTYFCQLRTSYDTATLKLLVVR